MLAAYFNRFSSITGPQRFWCAMFDILVASFVMLYLVPTADAYERAHPHALRIFFLNIFLGWTIAGWIAALVWSRKISPVEFYAARNRPRRAVGMNAWWAARLAVSRLAIPRLAIPRLAIPRLAVSRLVVPRAEAGRELLRNAATASANVRPSIERR
jgi:Superinfection immunity protein